jgi:hypothetical protein
MRTEESNQQEGTTIPNRMKREPEITTTVGTPVSVVQESTGIPIVDHTMAGTPRAKDE